MATRPNHALQRFLVLAVVGMVGIKFMLIGFMGVKPPAFHDGPRQVAEQGKTSSVQPVSPAKRQAQLEKLLAPQPVLTWANPNKDFALPKVAPAPVEPTPPAGTAETGSSENETLLPVAGIKVQPVYLKELPDLTDLTPDERKDQFIAYMLPLILRANKEIRQRQELIRQTIAEGNADRLKQWAELYRIDTSKADEKALIAKLSVRVRTVPISIALAQAAVESGWGTSRFLMEGNALFGQWAWSLDAGIQPNEPRYENAVVRSFSSLFDSVRAYIHNLNTHYAYADFRKERQHLSTPPTEDEIITLLETLHPYSEEGERYIKTLLTVMISNDLWIYDSATLAEE